MNTIFTHLAKEVAAHLNYQYPTEQERKMMEHYCQSREIIL